MSEDDILLDDVIRDINLYITTSQTKEELEENLHSNTMLSTEEIDKIVEERFGNFNELGDTNENK